MAVKWTDKYINWHMLPGSDVQRLIREWGKTDEQIAAEAAKATKKAARKTPAKAAVKPVAAPTPAPKPAAKVAKPAPAAEKKVTAPVKPANMPKRSNF